MSIMQCQGPCTHTASVSSVLHTSAFKTATECQHNVHVRIRLCLKCIFVTTGAVALLQRLIAANNFFFFVYGGRNEPPDSFRYKS